SFLVCIFRHHKKHRLSDNSIIPEDSAHSKSPGKYRDFVYSLKDSMILQIIESFFTKQSKFTQ
ncbi:hypothetical protein, partial [Anaerostipes hadrus]|uniref:hypothetical protein n=1 Tax=Anaerostipes hadrus TaxID=649756 RepID=UPI001A9B50C6